ncbi:MAG TPA: nucleotide sugar dehydrogenase [Anaeromyxobacter sp.]|nr:nucleotide sugar dehydrogenase [Anaeromyxobacter sp.]
MSAELPGPALRDEPGRALLARIAARTARVAVVGLGYVGLPLALSFARRGGLAALGVDVDAARADAVSEGRSPLRHVPSALVDEAVRAGRLEATTDLARAAACDAILVCVPTPLTRNREPDLSHVTRTAEALGPALRPGRLVVLESTTYPGTTDEVVRPALERASGLRAGRDFFLAFSPEREDPGSGIPTHTIPKIVGGHTPLCLEIALALYRAAFDRVVPVSSTRVAELAKLLENVFRSVNIALVNELKMLCDRMGIDVDEVVDAASTKPFGFMPFRPGPGLGGHCIPVDPFYLTWKAREFEFRTRFVELAGEVNVEMPRYVVQRTAEALNARGRPLAGTRVLVLGVAYKRGVDDVRESPALRILDLLRERGALVVYHDPLVPRVRRRGDEVDLVSVPLTDEALESADAVIVATDQDGIDWARVVARAHLVVDTRNACRSVTSGREKIVKA